MRQWIDRALWALITAVAGYASTQLKEMSQSIQALNTNVAVLIQQAATQQLRQNNVESEMDKARVQIENLSTRMQEIERRRSSKL